MAEIRIPTNSMSVSPSLYSHPSPGDAKAGSGGLPWRLQQAQEKVRQRQLWTWRNSWMTLNHLMHQTCILKATGRAFSFANELFKCIFTLGRKSPFGSRFKVEKLLHKQLSLQFLLLPIFLLQGRNRNDSLTVIRIQGHIYFLGVTDLMVLVDGFQKKDASKFFMRFLNILDYLENDPTTENSIISCIIQEPYIDRLILKEGSVSFITNKGPRYSIFFFQYNIAVQRI